MRRFIEASNYSSKRPTGDSIDRLKDPSTYNQVMIVRRRRAQHPRSEEDSRVQHRIGGALEKSIDPVLGVLLESGQCWSDLRQRVWKRARKDREDAVAAPSSGQFKAVGRDMEDLTRKRV